MLLNYLGQYNDMSTLAHELGHTMHSYYSNKTQPYALCGYHTFVAEVASTFNEALLLNHMLDQIKDEPTRISLLGNYLESIKSTVFRQTQLADFELRMHELGLKGQPITGDVLSKLYLEITRNYYGHDLGVVVVDDYVANEWSYIPHFYQGVLCLPVRNVADGGGSAVGTRSSGRPGSDGTVSEVSRIPAARSIRSSC